MIRRSVWSVMKKRNKYKTHTTTKVRKKNKVSKDQKKKNAIITTQKKKKIQT